MDDVKYWVWLSMVFGTGSRRIWDAVSLFGNAENTYFSLLSEGEGLNLTADELKNISSTDQKNATDFIRSCKEKGIGVVGYGDSDYPAQLRHIFNPPAVLYYKGNISCLNGTRTVTAVGTRNPSEYSLDAAYKICRELSRSGCVIVSGFAMGTDITTHMAAADQNRPTACVLGCGVDVDYPRTNFGFRDKIIESGGVFVSEYPPGTPPHPGNFPKRNRILAALGRTALIFEASKKSGSLITADMAASCGREVFCLPPADIFGSRYGGNIELLQNGATALYNAKDVLNCFRIGDVLDVEIRTESYTGVSDFAVSSVVSSGRSVELIKENVRKAPAKKSSKHKKNEEKTVEETAVNEETVQPAESDKQVNIDLDGLTELQQRIVKALSAGAVHADVLAADLNEDPAVLMTELTELELIGAVKSLPGKMFEINKQ